jgi:NitT/TauT family transport system substrate-binding protein
MAKSFFQSIFFLLSASLISCSSHTKLKTNKITIAEFGEVFLYAPLYVAQEKGFFKQQGLDVTILPTGGDEKTFAALLSGNAQFGVADPTFVAVSGEKGNPGKVVAAILSGLPFWGIAKDPKIPEIKSADELKDFTVATFPAPSTAFSLQKKMFLSANIPPNIRELAFGTLLAALETKQVDIALEIEPNVSIALTNGGKIVYAMADSYPHFLVTGLTALPEFIQDNPEITQKVVNAIHYSMLFIQQHPEETSELLSKRFPEVPKKIAENAVKNMIQKNIFPHDTIIQKEGWDAAIQLRLEVGDLHKPALFEDYVITTFSEVAKHKLQTLP